MAFLILLILITCALVVIALTAVLNVLVFPRLRCQKTVITSKPFVSVLIPARNEVANIERTVRALLAQTYTNFELIVLDDHSTDGTGRMAWQAGGGDPRLRVIRGRPLPEGWLGKNWACQQLSEAAAGERLVFTDADVCWSPDSLAVLLAMMESSSADLLTVWPTQQTLTWGERLVVPLMALAIFAYLPLPLVHHTRWPIFAAANGQCLAFRRRAYDAAGGHAAVRDNIVEDVALAHRIKARGLRLWMADGGGLITCRMYRDWPEVREGFGKNILKGHGDSVLLLGASTVFHWLVFVFPWLWLLVSVVRGAALYWPLALVILGVGTRMLSAAATRQRVFDGLLMPASVLLMTRIAVGAVWQRYRYGGPRWKGRTLHRKSIAQRRSAAKTQRFYG